MQKSTVTLLFVWMLLSAFSVHAQQQYTVSGTVSDKRTGETLIGALVRADEKSGVASNEYGFYSLTLEAGSYVFIVRYSGYLNDTIPLVLQSDTIFNIKLSTEETELEEVVVKAKKTVSDIGEAQMGMEKIDMKDLDKIPVLFGEKDIVKALQLLPGIKTVGDAGGGMYVRGGAADQNLILLDEALVYNPSHLLGFFSAFNADAVKEATVFKGTQPAQYGGRLSSALDIRMRDGNKENWEFTSNLGLIASKLSLEGPIVKGKSSLFVSGRRTYADVFMQHDDQLKGSKLYFYDLNAKVNYRFGQKDVLYLSGYFGRDKLGVEGLFGVDWGNATGTLRWNHIITNRWFSNTSLIVSNYNYLVGIERGGSDYNLRSDILDYSLKQEFQFFQSARHTLRYGLQSSFHRLVPGEVTGEDLNDVALQNRYSLENAVFISDEWKPSPRLSVLLGLRVSGFSVLGAGDFYTLDEARTVVDTVTYGNGELVKQYINPEPRLSLSWMIDSVSSIKVAYARNAQYLHLLSNSTVANPTDKWIASGNNIRPQLADQFSLGYFRNLCNGMFEIGAESYYKQLYRQLDYKDGADVLLGDQIETQLLEGKGRAYGVEFLIRKRSGKFTGWIGYTLSHTERKIDGINNNEWYVARQDKTHDISVVLNYSIRKNLSLSANWVYSTGNAVTFPTGKYYTDDQVVWLYTERNGYRMPAYHRLDLGLQWELKPRPHSDQELVFGIFNAYGRENAYMIDFRESETNPGQTEVVQTALFRFVPSISWTLHLK